MMRAAAVWVGAICLVAVCLTAGASAGEQSGKKKSTAEPETTPWIQATKKTDDGGTKQPDIVMTGHKPIQHSRVKAGTPILGFDFDQLSDNARMLLYFVLIGVFAGLMWLAYTLVAV